MKTFLLKKSFYIALLLSWSISSAIKSQEELPVLKLSGQEKNMVINNLETAYVYLGNELSNIRQVTKQVSNLYDLQGIQELDAYFDAGYKIGPRDAVIEVLTEVLTTLDDDVKSEKLAIQLEDNIKKLQKGELNVEIAEQDMRIWDEQTQESDPIDIQLQAEGIPIVVEEVRTHNPVVEEMDGLAVTNDALFENNFDIDNNLAACDTFRTIEEKYIFRKDSEFRKNVNVLEDLNIQDDLAVCGNIELKDSSAEVGNVLKDGTRFIHNFGTDNTFVGKKAGNFTMIGDANSGFGVETLSSNISSGNTAIGAFALKENTTGECSTAVGLGALFSNTTGNANIAIGPEALMSNETGSKNIAIGKGALENNRGNRNIGVGDHAGKSLTNGDNNIYVGSNATWPTESDTIRIGASQTDCFMQGIHGAVVNSVTDLPVYVDADGKLGTSTSSRKYKSNIIDMDTTSNNLMNLRPVQFTYNHDTSHKPHYGLIAEEVETVFPELVVRDNNGSVYSVRYHELPAMLLNELQKHHLKFQKYDIKIQELEDIIKCLLAEITALKKLSKDVGAAT